jgi:hypothetical protein
MTGAKYFCIMSSCTEKNWPLISLWTEEFSKKPPATLCSAWVICPVLRPVPGRGSSKKEGGLHKSELISEAQRRLASLSPSFGCWGETWTQVRFQEKGGESGWIQGSSTVTYLKLYLCLMAVLKLKPRSFALQRPRPPCYLRCTSGLYLWDYTFNKHVQVIDITWDE